MVLNLILNTVIPIFLIVLVGFIIGKWKKLDTQLYIDLIVYIAGPCLIFSSIARSNINFSDFSVIALSAVGVIISLTILVFIILRLYNSDKRGVYLPIAIGNTGFLGYPLALLAFGTDGLSRAVIFDMMNSLFLFSLGIYIIHHKNKISEAFKIPLIYAVIVGLIFCLLKIPIPNFVYKPIEMVGIITIPLALLILGFQLTRIKLGQIKIAFFASLSRIIGGFIIALAITKIFSISGLAQSIILIQASMPSAVMSLILTKKYKKDAELVASVVFITTLMSIVTIPLVLYLVSLT